MSIHQKFRGGAPVGQMDELPLLEMSAICLFSNDGKFGRNKTSPQERFFR